MTRNAKRGDYQANFFPNGDAGNYPRKSEDEVGLCPRDPAPFLRKADPYFAFLGHCTLKTEEQNEVKKAKQL